MRRLAILLALLVPASASASDGSLLAAKERYLPAVQSGYANTPDGAQPATKRDATSSRQCSPRDG